MRMFVSSCCFPLILLLRTSSCQLQNLDFGSAVAAASDAGSLLNPPDDHEHLQVTPAEAASPSHLIVLELLGRGTDAIHRKIEMLADVHDSVQELFENVIGRRRDGLPGELFNQLKMRCVEKIFNLKFLLQTVDRLVHERLHMERMSEVFSTLANKRTNDSQLLVTQIHRNAAELAESIRSDLGRAIEQVDGVTGGGLLGLGLGLGSPLLSSFSPFANLIDKISGLQKFKVQKDGGA